jgi:FtsH-binding integral membrane protein
MEGAIVVLTLCATFFGVLYIYLTTRHKQRLSLIEKEANASIFRIGKEQAESNSFGRIFSALKIGLFLIGAGLGVFMGYLFGTFGMHQGASYPSMILIFAGLGLVVFYLINRKSK